VQKYAEKEKRRSKAALEKTTFSPLNFSAPNSALSSAFPGETPGGAGLDAQMQLKMSRQFSSQPAPAAEQDAAPQSLMSTDFPEDKDDGFLDMLRNPAIREALQPQQESKTHEPTPAEIEADRVRQDWQDKLDEGYRKNHPDPPTYEEFMRDAAGGEDAPQQSQPEAAPQDTDDTKMDEGIHWGALQGNESLLQPNAGKEAATETDAPFEEVLQKAQIADGSVSQEEAPFDDELLRQPAAPNSEAPAANPLKNIPISLAPVGGAPKTGAESKPKYGLGDRIQMWFHRHTGRGALPEIQEGTPAEQYLSKKELFGSKENARQAMDPESEKSRRHKESLGKKDERMISPADQDLERRRKRNEEFFKPTGPIQYSLGDRFKMWYHRHTGRGALPDIAEGTPAERYLSERELAQLHSPMLDSVEDVPLPPDLQKTGTLVNPSLAQTLKPVKTGFSPDPSLAQTLVPQGPKTVKTGFSPDPSLLQTLVPQPPELRKTGYAQDPSLAQTLVPQAQPGKRAKRKSH